jgi:hypothetical protein
MSETFAAQMMGFGVLIVAIGILSDGHDHLFEILEVLESEPALVRSREKRLTVSSLESEMCEKRTLIHLCISSQRTTRSCLWVNRKPSQEPLETIPQCIIWGSDLPSDRGCPD